MKIIRKWSLFNFAPQDLAKPHSGGEAINLESDGCAGECVKGLNLLSLGSARAQVAPNGELFRQDEGRANSL
jgi:hypothetical protein